MDKTPTQAELHPQGRTLYYEGREELRFILAMRKRGLEVVLQVHVPADQLDAVMAEFPMGS